MAKRNFDDAFGSDTQPDKTPKRRSQPPLEVVPVTQVEEPSPTLTATPPATAGLIVQKLPEDCIHEIGLLLEPRDAIVSLYSCGSRPLHTYLAEYMHRRWQMSRGAALACLRQLAGIAEAMQCQDMQDRRRNVAGRERRFRRLSMVMKSNFVYCLPLLMPAVLLDANVSANTYNKRFFAMLAGAVSSGFLLLLRRMFEWLAKWRLFDVKQDQLALFDRAATHKDGPTIVWLADKLSEELRQATGSQYEGRILFKCLKVCEDQGMAPGFVQFLPYALLAKVATEAVCEHWPFASFACLPLGVPTFNEKLRVALTGAGHEAAYTAIQKMWTERTGGR